MSPSPASDRLPAVDASDVQAENRREFLEIVGLMDGFRTSLNDEYQHLCRMAVAICQAGSPVKRGKLGLRHRVLSRLGQLLD